VLTQFNSASLNRHISQTYRMDAFSQGTVEILAAEQTPDNPNWFQGTADAVRQAARHLVRYDADYYFILAGDHLYRMDYSELLDAHVERNADITIAAQPVSADDASSMGIFRFERNGQIVAFEEKPRRERLDEIARSIPVGATFTGYSADKPFVASMGVYVFSRDVLLEAIEQADAADFGRQIIPAALGRYRVNAHLFRGIGPTSERSPRSTTRTSCSPGLARRSSCTIRAVRSSPTRGICQARAWTSAALANRSSPKAVTSNDRPSRDRSSASGPRFKVVRRFGDPYSSAPTSTKRTTPGPSCATARASASGATSSSIA
jgi:ADP-glucose pyrophosphorylase